MKRFILILLWLSLGLSQVEVIKVFSNYTKTLYSELALSNGTSAIDDSLVYLAGEGAIYIQSRELQHETERLQIDIKNSKYFAISSILQKEDNYVIYYLGVDGMYRLCKVNIGGSVLNGPIIKHGLGGRIMTTKSGLILQAGLYRPLYATYLDLYDDESGSGPTELSKRKFKELYKASDAFFLSFYDESLTLVDSAANLPLKGEAAKAFESLYLSTPLDMDENGTIYFINHIDGYTINVVNPASKKEKKHDLWNEAFRPIPIDMTKEQAKTINSKSGYYSRAYALYTDNTYILTSFVQNSAASKPPAGPYYIDIMNMAGEQLTSMVSTYPVVTEDHESKVFFAVSRDGGWLEADELYLVGMTIQNILDGAAKKESIDKAIDQFIKRKQK